MRAQVDRDGRGDEGVGSVDQHAQQEEGTNVAQVAGVARGRGPVQGARAAHQLVHEQLPEESSFELIKV